MGYPSSDQLFTPNNKVLPRSQPQLSHDSHLMKRKLGEHLYGTRDEKRQFSTPLNKTPTRPQSSHDRNSQSRRSVLVAGGVMQEVRQEISKFKNMGLKGIRQEAERARQDGRMADAALLERRERVSVAKPVAGVQGENMLYDELPLGSTSGPCLQRSTKIGHVSQIPQNN